jgi:hypothetical protein
MTVRRLPQHPRLGRHVAHDPRSRSFRVPQHAAAAPLVATRHEAHIGILDQGNLGSCTGQAGLAAIYRAPYVSAVVKPWRYPADESGAVALYSRSTAIDPYPGAYPPDDTGSDGLSIAKVLKADGIVSEYRWAFTLAEALGALMTTPLITGVPWFESMFDTDGSGHVVVDEASGLAGGHELCVDEFRPGVGTSPAMVGGPNSWGNSWGDNGRWYLTVDEWGRLLSQDGDVTAFVPATAPQPTPGPDDDATLWQATKAWAAARHVGANAQAARAVQTWAKCKGLS